MFGINCGPVAWQRVARISLSTSALLAFASAFAAGTDPLDANAPVPSLKYRSAFSDFRPLGDEKVGDWRGANDTVRTSGGWRAYLKESQAPESPTPTSATPGSETSGPIAPTKAPEAGSDGSAPTPKPKAPEEPKKHDGHSGHSMK